MANELDTYNPGDVIIDEMTITNFKGDRIDIRTLFLGFSIHEDLFNSVMMGELHLTDANDIQQNLPLIGEEKLNIIYKTDPDGDLVEVEFELFELVGREPINETSYKLIFSFCSQELMISKSSRICKSFVSKSVDDIVRFCFSQLQSDKSLTIHPTQGLQNYVAPNEHPIKIINTMLPRARSTQYTEGSSFVFFENRDGFKFDTIENLIQSDPIEYTFLQKNVMNDKTRDKAFSVNSYEILQQYNVLDSMMKGSFGSTVHSIDLLTRSFGTNQYSYLGDDYLKTEHIENTTELQKLQTSQFKFATTQPILKFVTKTTDRLNSAYFKSHTSLAEANDKRHHQNLSLRYAQIQQFTNAFRLRIEVPGNSDLRCGGTIELDNPSFTPNDIDTEEQDLYIAGKYLITSLKEHVTKQEATTTMELTKDSYGSEHETTDRTRFLTLVD